MRFWVLETILLLIINTVNSSNINSRKEHDI